jgi:tetratricopeptide (TPR) repeat protein
MEKRMRRRIKENINAFVMKKNIVSLITLMLFAVMLNAQQGKSPGNQKPPDLNKMMEEDTKNMTPEQKEQMKKMMGGAMPAFDEKNKPAFYPDFTDNKQLIPKRDVVRINAIPKKKLMQADISLYATNLYTKLMAKGSADEIVLIKKVLPKCTSANDFGNAAIVCMMQGHAQAAMAFSMKAVIADPANAKCQNNMASLLTQYGYPEQAIPVLQKLENDFPDNSTVLNNLAQAWFSLGERDSAKVYSLAAIKSNPLTADAQVCGGVLDEGEGNTEEAIKKYTHAMEQSPDGFTESVLKNSAGQNGINDIDYDNLIENITIYDYFPKDWIQIPELSNSVSGFENDIAVKNGYAKMFLNFNKDIQFKIDQSQAEIKNLMKQGNEGFAIEMMAAGTKHGTSFISTPARIIVSLIILKLTRLSQDYTEMKIDITNYMERKMKEKINAGKNDNCEARDNRNNKFLEEVNHSNRVDFEFWIEQYRRWLNAYCTWTWYHTGNIKNSSMVQCLSFTKFYAELFRDAIAMLQTASPNCKEGIRSDGEIKPYTPLIPSFKCPTVVSVPAGPDWHALDNKLKNFDANSLDIKKIPGAPIPNMSMLHNNGSKTISQTNRAPVTKIANGSILPAYGGATLPEYPNRVSNKEVNAKVDEKASQLQKKTNQKKTQGMITTDCDKDYWSKNQKKIMAEIEQNDDLLDEIKKLKEEVKKLEEQNKKEAIEKELNDELAPLAPRKNPPPTLSSSVQALGVFQQILNLFK